MFKVNLCATCAATLKRTQEEHGEDAMRLTVLDVLLACESCRAQFPPAPPGVTRLVMRDHAEGEQTQNRAERFFAQLKDEARELAACHARESEQPVIQACQQIDVALQQINATTYNVGFCLGLRANDVVHLYAEILMVVAGYLCKSETGMT